MILTPEEDKWFRQALMKFGILELLTPSEIDILSQALLKKTFATGKKILVEGDSSDFVYLIRKGEAVITVERQRVTIPVGTVKEGEFFGESAVLTRYPRNATVTAKCPVEIYMIFREDFRKILKTNPAVAQKFEKMSSSRTKNMEQTAALATVMGALKKIFLKKIHFRLRRGTVKNLSNLIQKSSRVLVLTGAGLSRKSGFSEIHTKGGIWDRYQPVGLEEFLQDQEKRKEYWRRKKEFMSIMHKAKPNISHQSITQLERSGKLLGVITQNIDGLHQMAGTSAEKVIELNGTNREIICMNCAANEPWQKTYETLISGNYLPQCPSCGGILKPKTVSIGQTMDQDLLFKAISWAKNCDLLAALGSSLLTDQITQIIQTAKQHGAKFAIVNMSETPLDTDADLILNMPVEDAVPSAFA